MPATEMHEQNAQSINFNQYLILEQIAEQVNP